MRLFQALNLEVPEDLEGILPAMEPEQVLTLWRGAELFLKYPEVRTESRQYKYQLCLAHLVEYFGKDFPIKNLWAPEIRAYQVARLEQGASPSTVNWEKGTLSKMFRVLVERRLLEANPVRLVPNLSQKSEERQAYLSRKTVEQIASHCPSWFTPLLWTAFFTGMRRGEILGLIRRQVNLDTRMIVLQPESTKEGHWKRVPIHFELVPILRQVLDGPALMSGRVFPLRDRKGFRDIDLETWKNVWPRACEALRLSEPRPRFHDLRHTWRANARRSGMDPDIAERIMGHQSRGRKVHERYGAVDDAELIRAIDLLEFDHGETEVIVAASKKRPSNKLATSEGVQRVKRCGHIA